jgi:hypothetical protein
MRLDLEALGLEEGADILLRRGLRSVAPGDSLEVVGTHRELRLQLRSWARAAGVALAFGQAEQPVVARLTPGTAAGLPPTERAGTAALDGVVGFPPRHWGLAARGAAVEQGAPAFDFGLIEKLEVWSDDASRLYKRAAAAQWDPETAIDWRQLILHDDGIETAVVQVMTYLIENETAALLVPARFASQIHPHFREVLQLLAIQAADEARHMEVFTRRAVLRHAAPGLSTSGGQASLKTLVGEPDFAIASFLLSVMGEGSFLVLLDFLAREGPDPITRDICRLAAQDEARHVAFGLAHLRRHAAEDATLRPRLAMAMQRRHAELAQTSGLNALVFEALTLIAANGYAPAKIARGHARIMQLQADMDQARRSSLIRLGFDAAEAEALSGLHTRNFM